MSLIPFVATATTCHVEPGTEASVAGGMLQVRGRVFTDTVESAEPLIAGTNRPELDIDLDPARGEGSLRGRFVLTPTAAAGRWEGELAGKLANGLVRATGLARGAGELTGSVLHVEFRQVPAHPSTPPCAAPIAYFEMTGTILTAG